MKRILAALAAYLLFSSQAFAAYGGTVNQGAGAAASAPWPVNANVTGNATNPASTLTLTATTTAYSAGQLIANNATGASVTVPSFTIANNGGAAWLQRLRLVSNDTTSTAWPSVIVYVDLWSAAPTFTNGDRTAYSPTGAANWLATFVCTFSATIYADGIPATCVPLGGQGMLIKLSGQTLYWTAYAFTASGVTGASKTLTLTPELYN